MDIELQNTNNPGVNPNDVQDDLRSQTLHEQAVKSLANPPPTYTPTPEGKYPNFTNGGWQWGTGRPAQADPTTGAIGRSAGNYFAGLAQTQEPSKNSANTARASMLGATGAFNITKGIGEGIGYGLGSIPSALIGGAASVWSSSINLENSREERAQQQAQWDQSWKAATDAGLFSPAQFGGLSASMGNTYGRQSVPTLRARPGSQFT